MLPLVLLEPWWSRGIWKGTRLDRVRSGLVMKLDFWPKAYLILKKYVVGSFLQLASIILESQQTVSCGHVRVDLLFPSPSPSVEWLHNDEEEPEALDFVPRLAFPLLLPQGLVHLSELQTGACLRRNC